MANANSRISRKTESAALARLQAEFNATRAARESERRQAELKAERKARDGITLRGLRLKQALDTMSNINMSALSIHGLALTASTTSDIHEQGSYLTAIENSAMLVCRYADLVAKLLGDDFAFGNFENELVALTPERAAELEREEAEVRA